MLFQCFVWGIVLLSHVVNSAPQPFERQRNFSTVEEEFESKIDEALGVQDFTETTHRQGDIEGHSTDSLPEFTRIIGETVGDFEEETSDSDVKHSTSSDTDNHFSTTLILEGSQEQSEIPTNQSLQDNSHFVPSSKVVESNDSVTTNEKELKEEGNGDLAANMESKPFIADDDSSTRASETFHFTTSSEIINDSSSPSISFEKTEDSDSRDIILFTSKEHDGTDEAGNKRNKVIPNIYSNYESELSTVGFREEYSLPTTEFNKNLSPLSSDSAVKSDVSDAEEEQSQTPLEPQTKNNLELYKGITGTTDDSLRLGISLSDDPFITLDPTKNIESDFKKHAEEHISKLAADVSESITLSDIESTNKSSTEKEISESVVPLTSSSHHASDGNADISTSKNNDNEKLEKVSENSDHGSNPAIDNDFVSPIRTETANFYTDLTTTTSKDTFENKSETVLDISATTQILPIERTGVSIQQNSSSPNTLLDFKPSDDNNTTTKFKEYHQRYVSGNNTDSIAAVQFLHYHDKASSEECHKLVKAHWNYATNLTEENKKKQLEQTFEYSQFHKEAWKNATSFDWKSFNDTLLRRWFKSLSILGNSALPEDKLNEFNRLKADMKNTYSTAKVCNYSSIPLQNDSALGERTCHLSLEPDLTRILTKSRDYDELLHVWKAWRDAAGKPIREKYLRLVELGNEAATLNGFADAGDMWREAYESDTFEEDLDRLWDQLRPLYQHLHAYVRRKLIQQYTTDKIKEDGPIPAHLLGNMWAQSWVSLLDIAQPFPGKPSVDVTTTMEAKNMTALEMFKISEEFFTSLGLKPMPEEFWKHSIIEKPRDREIVCHASAWDFCNGKDYRIKQCTDITMEDLITVHHEMGHIQYFLQYSRQPNVFREGANPGFHEAIGDVLALSVSTPKHLKSIGLLEDVADDPEGDLNFLLRTALDKISFIPSGYLIDLWRWGLFNGKIKSEEMNTKWWELRLKYQGICPPVRRTDSDFDPGAKYHVPGNVPYIRYFVSFVIQFQFHKVLCDAAGHTGPLYKCDIYKSKEAGQILSQVMELGSSEHWSETMKIMTGGATGKMDAQPILEYFKPLFNWLKEQNQNETLGWKSNDATLCP